MHDAGCYFSLPSKWSPSRGTTPKVVSAARDRGFAVEKAEPNAHAIDH
jgi:hypothetical protein